MSARHFLQCLLKMIVAAMVEDARLPALVELQQASQIPHLHHHSQPKLGGPGHRCSPACLCITSWHCMQEREVANLLPPLHGPVASTVNKQEPVLLPQTPLFTGLLNMVHLAASAG